MAIYRAQIGFPMDSAFPRDIITVNPHYQGDNAQGLADALKANLLASTQVGATKPFHIKVYDAQKPPPSYPLAEAANGTGFATSTTARELALCLSYYTAVNRPTYRGRIYIPHVFVGGTVGQRPTSGQMAAAGTWATIFGKNLPGEHFWSLYSHKRNAAGIVSNWWVDDEWDIVRSRGLKGTTRQVGTNP